MRRDGPFAGIEGEESTAFLRAHYSDLKKAGLVTARSFEAWARELGIIVASNHGWDDTRRRRVYSLQQVLDSSERSDYRAAGPGPNAEVQMHPIPTGGKRRSRRRRRPQTTE